jgi:anion-transporting  ArsA/GET3 family ATPase
MALILTFLGKGGTGRTTIAIAAAKQLATSGKRVLLCVQETGPVLGLLLGITPTASPQSISTNLDVVQFQTAALLERAWDELKSLEAQYLRTPFFKAVYGQELNILPGMDSALALNALREYDASGQYDVLVYDGLSDQTTLRMLAMPEGLNWYFRRFKDVFLKSDFNSLVMPLLQPIISTVLTVGNSVESATQPLEKANNLLESGQQAVQNPSRCAAYLVTTSDPLAIARAMYLWGSAQQVGLTVGGILLNSSPALSAGDSDIPTQFAPLPLANIPLRQANNWEPLMAVMPNVQQAVQAPRPIEIDVPGKTVRLFLPGFDKKQVKLNQSGPEITIEAGDQRRNLMLPVELSGRSASGAKFQDNYLTIFL